MRKKLEPKEGWITNDNVHVRLKGVTSACVRCWPVMSDASKQILLAVDAVKKGEPIDTDELLTSQEQLDELANQMVLMLTGDGNMRSEGKREASEGYLLDEKTRAGISGVVSAGALVLHAVTDASKQILLAVAAATKGEPIDTDELLNCQERLDERANQMGLVLADEFLAGQL